ncbi:MAG: helix-turn-helix domain-containing protein [Bdellovibrionales bacterium]
MARSLIIVVSDDYNEIQKARSWGQENGYDVKAYTSAQWSAGLDDPSFRSNVANQEISLAAGFGGGITPVSSEGATVLPFPGVNQHTGKRVATINEVESMAIENAIFEFKGNLTEAARALGIGRATLYRKVKQYGIDPSAARRRTPGGGFQAA